MIYLLNSIRDLRQLPPAEQECVLNALSADERLQLMYRWDFWARIDQLIPTEILTGEMLYWLIKAGRGFGKTRIGAETVRRWVQDVPMVNLIGATADDARDIMIEGESGILRICPKWERPTYLASKRRLEWPNGAISLIFTADEPERLRGKQHMKLWADELASWRYAESWDQALLGLRLGPMPQAVITTTPRNTPLVKDVMKDPDTFITNGRTKDNFENLAPAFIKRVVNKYEGTRLGRQELDGELLDDNPNAVFHRADIDKGRINLDGFAKVTALRFAVGVDPSVSAKENSDLCGIVAACIAWNIDGRLHAYVTDDESLIAKPGGWAMKVVSVYHRRCADRIVAEVNNGGDMVEGVVRTVDKNVSYKAVHATRGKIVRAEPISALYEQGRVHHVGSFAKLEDEMCDYDPLTAEKSPDRMDALVWVLTDLMLGPQGADWSILGGG